MAETLFGALGSEPQIKNNCRSREQQRNGKIFRREGAKQQEATAGNFTGERHERTEIRMISFFNPAGLKKPSQSVWSIRNRQSKQQQQRLIYCPAAAERCHSSARARQPQEHKSSAGSRRSSDARQRGGGASRGLPDDCTGNDAQKRKICPGSFPHKSTTKAFSPSQKPAHERTIPLVAVRGPGPDPGSRFHERCCLTLNITRSAQSQPLFSNQLLPFSFCIR